MIEVNHLTKQYGIIKAVDQVTFRIKKGEIVAFLGPNGAGKTTTMRIIAGSLSATSGNVRVAGFDVFEQPMEVKKRIGYLPEVLPLYPDMTVNEYLRFVGKIKQISSKAILSAIQNVLNQCHLDSVKNRLLKNLSKGFQQRVGLAQALIHHPEVLILDEPTVGLDPNQIIEIRELIRSLAGAHTIILSTHILPEATALCQRALIIHEGHIVAEDTPEKLSANLRKSEKVNMIIRRGNDEVVNAIKSIPGMMNVMVHSIDEAGIWNLTAEYPAGSDFREEIARTIIQKGAGLIELKSQILTLEDIFLKLTQDEAVTQNRKENA